MAKSTPQLLHITINKNRKMSLIKSNQYENLLREPVEKWSAYTFFIGGVISFSMPEILMLPPLIGKVGALAFGLMGYKHYRSARKLKRYQKQLINLPAFVQSSDQIGYSKKQLYLGKGFLWDERHTQRMYDLEKAIGRKFRDMPWLYTFARNLERKYEHNNLLQPILKFTQSHNKFNPVKPIPPVGGIPALHAVGMWEGEQDITLDNGNRNGHTIVLGTTRVGKTRLLEIIVSQDIRRGDVVIVIDPKGDADLVQRVYVEAMKANRLDDLYIFHLGYPEVSDAYNPISSFMRVTEVASRVAGQMPNEGQSSAFREFVWGYVNTVANALVTMGIKPNYEILKRNSESIAPLFVQYMEWYFKKHFDSETYKEIMAEYDTDAIENHIEPNPDTHYAEFNRAKAILGLSAKERNEAFQSEKDWFAKADIPQDIKTRSLDAQAYYILYKKYGLNDNVGNQLCTKVNYNDAHLSKLIASLQPFLDKMTTGAIAELIAPPPDSTKRQFNWRDVIQRGGIVYVGLDALSDPEVAAAVGNSMFSDLTSLAGQIYKTGHSVGLPQEQGLKKNEKNIERTIYIHADEFNELIGDEFIPMLNKAGGAGVRVTAYTQTLADIEARLGNVAKAQQVLGNFNTQIMMRVQGEESARLISDRLKEVNVVTADVISGSTDNPDLGSGVTFGSSTTQRLTAQKVAMIKPHDIMSLPKGQAFVLQDGNKLFKIRSPLPDSRDLKGLPTEIAEMVKQMRKTYSTRNSTQISRNWGAISTDNIQIAQNYAKHVLNEENSRSDSMGLTGTDYNNSDPIFDSGMY